MNKNENSENLTISECPWDINLHGPFLISEYLVRSFFCQIKYYDDIGIIIAMTGFLDAIAHVVRHYRS